MLKDIINIIKEVSLKHKGVKTFKYQSDDLNNAQNNHKYYQVYVDDISLHQLNITTNIFKAEFQVYVLGFVDEYKLDCVTDKLVYDMALLSAWVDYPYEEIEDLQDDAIFKHKVLKVELPLRKATMEEYHHAVRELEYYIDKNKDKEVFNFEDNARMHVHAGTIRRYREQQNMEIVPIEMHVIRFGNISIVTNPFELFLDYGNRIKARSYAEQTFIAQLCCGGLGYLPTEKAEKGSHYSAYISSGWVGHEGGDLLVRKTIEEINDMWKEQ